MDDAEHKSSVDTTKASTRLEALPAHIRGALLDPAGRGARYLREREHQTGVSTYLDFGKEGRFHMVVPGVRHQFLAMLLRGVVSAAEVFSVVDKKSGCMYTYSREVETSNLKEDYDKFEVWADILTTNIVTKDADHSLAWKKSTEPYELSNVILRDMGNEKFRHYLFDFAHGNLAARSVVSEKRVEGVLTTLDDAERRLVLERTFEKVGAIRRKYEGPRGKLHFHAQVDRLLELIADLNEDTGYSGYVTYPDDTKTERRSERTSAYQVFSDSVGVWLGDATTDRAVTVGITKYWKHWCAYLASCEDLIKRRLVASSRFDL